MDEKNRKILSRMEAMCSKREYCKAEAYEKILKYTEGDADAADEIMESLVSDKFVDDYRYAAAFAREKSSISGWGPVKIRFALRAKRVGSEAIDAAFGDVDPDKADDRMRKLLEAKWKTLDGDPQGKLKLIRFALGRGYEYDQVRALVDEICRG